MPRLPDAVGQESGRELDARIPVQNPCLHDAVRQGTGNRSPDRNRTGISSSGDLHTIPARTFRSERAGIVLRVQFLF